MRAAIADDYTGATDLAGNWRARGLKTSVVFGVPTDEVVEKMSAYDAVVVAIKMRSIDPADARSLARQAGEKLLAGGVSQIYDKYCSTFDSTPEGNIGPIADELSELTGARHAVVVPSFPDAGRTVYKGHLFVGDELLDESPMKDHPLNPMWASSLVTLMSAQTDKPVGLIPLQVVRQGSDALKQAIADHDAHYIVVDAITNEDLTTIAEATIDDILITAGSGVALGLPATGQDLHQVTKVEGKKLVLSGSASAQTQKQVAHGKAAMAHRKVDVQGLVDDLAGEVEAAVAWAKTEWEWNPSSPILIYSVESKDDVVAAKAISSDASALIEQFMGEVAARLYTEGARQIISAGGETSGSIIDHLGIDLLDMGEPLGPGLSWQYGQIGEGELNIVLKSGNFGDVDLFTAAWDEL